MIVSPISISAVVFRFATRYPESPGPSFFPIVIFGLKVPTSLTSYLRPPCINIIGVPAVNSPEITRTYAITPRNVSNTLSKTRAFSSFPSAPLGAGKRATIASRTSSIPCPVFALTKIASSPGIAKISSNCFFTPGISELGKSILLMIGIKVSPSLFAK